MAMAIHSAKIASELIVGYFKTGNHNRRQLEIAYQKKWQYTFGRRLSSGRRFQSALLHPVVAETLMQGIKRSPVLLRKLIEYTHGKPIMN
jgi:flavin-dependent dehydrogenase